MRYGLGTRLKAIMVYIIDRVYTLWFLKDYGLYYTFVPVSANGFAETPNLQKRSILVNPFVES